MNLRGVVRGAIRSVNPDQQVGWQQYLSANTDPTTAITTPQYAVSQPRCAQVQPLSTDQLAQMEQMNIQGVLREVRLRGAIASAVREDGTGGDLLQFPELKGGPMRTWLVMAVTEQWPTWCTAIVRMQDDQTASV